MPADPAAVSKPATGRRRRPLNRRVYALSLGCPKNLVDTERFLAGRLKAGYRLAESPEKADLLFLNTCAFLTEAVRESESFLEQLASLKRPGRQRLYLAGCLVARQKEELLRRHPAVDRLIYPTELAGLAGRCLCTPGHYAYLKIAEGCDNRCAYCLIPSLRGSLASYPARRLEAEARALAALGVRELNLVAQDTTAYGRDRGKKDGLARLLERLVKIEELRWIRLLYTYPTGYSERLIECLARHAIRPDGTTDPERKICAYLDIPLQHAAPRILAAMGRRGGVEEYRRLIERLRREIPGLNLRTSMIVGFPGERESDFLQLLDFIRAIEFEKLGAFAYSAEPGTRAASFPGQVSASVKEERRAEIFRVQREISRRQLSKWLGRETEVLVDGPDPEAPGRSRGRSQYEAPEVDGEVKLAGRWPAGEFLRVKITAIRDYDLVGQPLARGIRGRSGKRAGR